MRRKAPTARGRSRRRRKAPRPPPTRCVLAFACPCLLIDRGLRARVGPAFGMWCVTRVVARSQRFRAVGDLSRLPRERPFVTSHVRARCRAVGAPRVRVSSVHVGGSGCWVGWLWGGRWRERACWLARACVQPRRHGPPAPLGSVSRGARDDADGGGDDAKSAASRRSRGAGVVEPSAASRALL